MPDPIYPTLYEKRSVLSTLGVFESDMRLMLGPYQCSELTFARAALARLRASLNLMPTRPDDPAQDDDSSAA